MTMKKQLLPRAILAAILLVVPAAADAPRDPPQYERFDVDSLTIKDNFTKLEWDRRSIITGVSYGGADLGCSSLTTLSASGRLPTVKELLTILDEEPHDEYEFGKVVPKMIDALAFADTPADLPYWTSTPAGVNQVWALSFSTGLMVALSTNASGKGNARCVR
jgi:hypothetical protein